MYVFDFMTKKARVGGAQQHTTPQKATDQRIKNIKGYFIRKQKAFNVITSSKTKYILGEKVNKILDKADDNPYALLSMDTSDLADIELQTPATNPITGQPIEVRGDAKGMLNTFDDMDNPEVIVKTSRKRRVPYQNVRMVQTECQPISHQQVQANHREEDIEFDLAPKRLIAKVAASKKSRRVYSRLYNFLRCKHFMHFRDHTFITTLVADARSWLLSNDYKLDNPMDYGILSCAVMHSFLVSQEELNFRARIKDPIAINHIEHLNATMQGNLGRVSLFRDGLKRSLARSARRTLLPSISLARPPISV